MQRAEFRAFTQAITARLRVEPGVLGLVALGSTADTDRAPDACSDHDLWIIGDPDQKESLRTRQDWLPRPETIALAFRETEHGVKVVYDDGHLVEYAVFSLDELHVARANVHRVLFGPPELEAKVAALVTPPSERSTPRPDWLIGQALTHLLVGVGRHRRGEHLSARRFVEGQAVERIVGLVRSLEPAQPGSGADDLDPFRRFELAHPDRAEALAAALAEPVPECARRLLAVLESVVGPDRPEYGRAFGVVRRALGE